MPKLQIEATALKHTDVNFVSLVKHGANRIPFRILKEDTEAMLDLGKISRTLFRKADAAPAVVAVLVSKSADQARVEATLTASGLVLTQKSETEDAVVYAQPNVAAGPRDATLRLNDDVALVVAGLAELPSRVQKDFSPYNGSSTSFLEVLNTEGFFPSMMMATGALQDVIMNIMSDAQDPAGAAALVATAIDDFKAYVVPCISGIPVRAFKADVALRKATDAVLVGVAGDAAQQRHAAKPGNQAAASGSGVGEGANPNGTGYDPEEDRKRATKAEASIGVGTQGETSPVNADQGRPVVAATPGGEAPIGTQRTAEPGGIEATQEGARPTAHGGKMPIAGEAPIGTGVKPETSPVLDAQGRGDATVAGLMKGFEDVLAAQVAAFRTEVLASLTTGLAAVQKDVAGVGKRLDGVELRTTKAEEALGGTALLDATDDPPPRRQRAVKAEGLPPLLDTGFSRAA